MLNNLIESSSHAREFRRRGSYILFTATIYVLLFVVAGVVSIYAFDAQLEEPNNIIVAMLPRMDLASTPEPVSKAAGTTKDHGVRYETGRDKTMAEVNQPLVPEKISAKPNESLPGARQPFTAGLGDPASLFVGGPGGESGTGAGTYSGTKSLAIDVGTAPPPLLPPVQKPRPRIISKGPITGLAISLPKPSYPPIGKQIGAHGPVNVQVLIDEAGNVVSAKAVSGHPLLMAAAVQAAYGARFSPTTLGGQAVKISGVITYNFVLQ